MGTARKIDRCLSAACHSPDGEYHHFLLWLLLKWDFYQCNGFIVPPPSIDETLAAAERHPADADAVQAMLGHIDGAEEAFHEMFGSDE